MKARENNGPGRAGGKKGATGGCTGRDVVRAAGCVLWRRAPETVPHAVSHSEPIQIALVHRPKYDDWSHPKGKLEPGEDPLRGALREVHEETGYDCVPGVRLPTVRYLAKGRCKEVSYWAAEATEGHFVPNREVDRLVWLSPSGARLRLSYEHDRALVDAFLKALHRS